MEGAINVAAVSKEVFLMKVRLVVMYVFLFVFVKNFYNKISLRVLPLIALHKALAISKRIWCNTYLLLIAVNNILLLNG